MEKQLVYLGLGGNLGDVLTRLKKALGMISATPHIYNFKSSHFYSTQPIEVKNPDWFVNAVCSFSTTLSAEEIFQMTQAIEKELGKENRPKNSDRPIDIDVLFYGQKEIKNRDFEIPHLHWKRRLFVLIPLLDLTHEVKVETERGMECYQIKSQIDQLGILPDQGISLLEKNPDFK